MKILASVIVGVLFCGGCSFYRTPATLASAESFHKVLLAELQKAGPVENFRNGGDRGGSTCSKEWVYNLPSSAFPATNLATFVKAAQVKWGQLERYRSHGKGIYAGWCSMEYGDNHSHAFIDVIAIPEGDKTRVMVLARVQE
jgi:hypothetical protein